MSRTRKFPTTESAKDRRDLGAVYTPLWMARTIVDRTMSFAAVTGEDSKLRILDPACGDGIFLQAAYESLLSTHDKTSRKSSDFAKRLTIAKEGIFGVDVDEVAVHAARRRIAQLIVSSHRREESPSDSMARDEVRNL